MPYSRCRVFLCGEWDFAGPLALQFVEYHRFTAISYKTALRIAHLIWQGLYRHRSDKPPLSREVEGDDIHLKRDNKATNVSIVRPANRPSSNVAEAPFGGIVP